MNVKLWSLYKTKRYLILPFEKFKTKDGTFLIASYFISVKNKTLLKDVIHQDYEVWGEIVDANANDKREAIKGFFELETPWN